MGISKKILEVLKELSEPGSYGVFRVDGKWRVNGKACSQAVMVLMGHDLVVPLRVESEEILTKAVITKKGRAYLAGQEKIVSSGG